MIVNRKQFRRALHLGAAAGALCLIGMPLQAQDAPGAPVRPAPVSASGEAPVEERQSYALRLMMQIYDGRQDFSHTQLLGIGRIRKGDRSFTQYDFGDGAVVIGRDDGELAVSRFLNLSPFEKAVLYDYRTKTVSGDDEIALFHNLVVRPLLGRSPDLGRNAEWTAQLPLAELGLVGAGEATAAVALSREYFVHDGKPMVLVHYAIPAFVYDDLAGRQVVHWGSGLLLSDPGFGMIYLNTALHRAVARGNGASGVPYRFSRTMVAANPDGSAMLDYRTVPQLQKYVAEFFSKEALQVVPTGERSLDDTPITLARNLDVVALSIAEDGANEAPMTAVAQTSADRGAEATSAAAALRIMQAQQDQNQVQQIADQTASQAQTGQQQSAEVLLNTQVRPFSTEEQTGGPPSGSDTGGSLADEVSPETLAALEQSSQSGSGITGSLTLNNDPNALFGGQGPDSPYFDDAGMTGEDGSLAQSQYWLDKAMAILGGTVQRLDQMTSTERADAALGVAQTMVNRSASIASNIRLQTTTIEQTQEALKTSGKTILQLTPEVQSLQSGIESAASRLGQAEGVYEALLLERARMTSEALPVPVYMSALLDNAEDELNAARAGLTRAENAFEVAIENGRFATQFDMADPTTARLVDRLGDAYRNLARNNELLQQLNTQAEGLGALMRSLPVQQAADFLRRIGDSPAGKLLDGLSHGLNAYTTGKAGYNVYTASTTDMSSGDLDLTRSHSLGEFGLDILALAGNAVSGNAVGFYSDAMAMVSGSISDIYVANKAWNDTIIDNQRRHEDLMANMRRLTRMIQEQERQKLAELKAEEFGLYTSEPTTDGGVSDPDWQDPRIDPETGLPKPGYWAYLKEHNPGTLASYGIDPEAPVGGWPGGVGPEHRPTEGPQVARSDPPADPPVFDINDGEDYPTAPPRDPDANRPEEPDDEPVEPELTPEEQQELDIQRRKEEAQESLEAYQAQKLAEMEAEEAARAEEKGTPEFRVSTLETSELLVSEFDIEPVTFDPVTMDPVEWVPVTMDPAVFDEDEDLFVKNPDGTTSLRQIGPNISTFPPTDPDDTDGYPGTGEMPAFGFESMSGQEPDISQWAEWLATQDVRKLEMLAIAAGYPSLAFALADAENIIRKSQDQGFRAYVNRGPNCAGYTGCTGSLGPWKLAYATVNLGDVLAQSREIFSTGGFSDIGISGFNLMYLLRDHGIQDGDLIDVEISQFGREIFRLTDHFLLNEGSNFNVNLRPGVAQMVITALNEGSARPNTAQITIDNVVRGEDTQIYSLNTGQTAVLRIESNAQPGN